MIEIVCPSCGARYQVPDDSIGPEGRKVTCSGCSHKWRAYREEAPAAVAAGPSGAVTAGAGEAEGDDRVGRSAADFGEEAPAAAAGSAGREQQMDNIRRMLDDLKRSSDDAPGPDPDAAAARPSRPEPSRRYREEQHDEALDDEAEVDPLRSRIEQAGRQGKEARPSNYDAARLRRMHEKRARRLQKAKERKRRSSGFLTGFTLVAVVAAIMLGLYVMRPQIVASSPELAPAMNQYVVTVDRYRVALDEATADWRAWVAERVGPMLGGEEGEAEPQQQGEPAGTAQ